MKAVSILLVAALLLGCAKDAQRKSHTDNPSFTVDFLFEHEGVRVYRFMDEGRYIYYTDARGATHWKTSSLVGKVVITTPHSVPTIR